MRTSDHHCLLPVLSNVDIFSAAVSFCAHSDPTNQLNSCCLFGTGFALRMSLVNGSDLKEFSHGNRSSPL
jgi:hypothetical protein